MRRAERRTERHADGGVHAGARRVEHDDVGRQHAGEFVFHAPGDRARWGREARGGDPHGIPIEFDGGDARPAVRDACRPLTRACVCVNDVRRPVRADELNDVREQQVGNRGVDLHEPARRRAGSWRRDKATPYFIAAHPGTTDEDMLELALWLKENGYRADQVQAFLPGPMATATAMYHTGKNPLRRVTRDSEEVVVPKGLKIRRLHKAFLRYHDANNWPMLREALKRMGREDLIGSGKRHLVPRYQPKGTGQAPEGRRRGSGKPGKTFKTQHVR
jgi:hypothetical protein